MKRRRLCLVLLVVAVWPASVSAQQAQRGPSATLTLRELLSDVMADHPLIGAAEARVRAAQGARRTAGRPENPLLAYQVENAALPGGTAPPMEREAMMMLMLPLQSLYQRWPRVDRAEAELEAARAEAALERQRVGLAAARAFYRTALAQIGLEVDRDLVAWLDSVVAYNRVRVDEGITAESDLIRSELERDRAATGEAMQAAELASAQAELGAFLAHAGSVRIAYDTIPFVLAQTAPSDSATIDRRFDVRAAQLRVRASRAGVGVERSMLFRELDVTMGLKQSAGTTSLIAGASVPFPLFNQGRGEVARATAEREAAELELTAVERAASAEVTAAREAARVLTERTGTLAAGYLQRANQARDITFGAYREGAVPLIQVLDATRAWGEARRMYYAAMFAQHESVLALLAAEGFEFSAIVQLLNR